MAAHEVAQCFHVLHLHNDNCFWRLSLLPFYSYLHFCVSNSLADIVLCCCCCANRNSGYGAPQLRKADRSIPPTIAPLQNETTYSAAFTKDVGSSAPQYGTMAAREILERRNWHTSPMPLAPDEKRRGQERTKVQWVSSPSILSIGSSELAMRVAKKKERKKKRNAMHLSSVAEY